MQRRAVKLHFDNEDMDFNLMWVLGQNAAGGAELGECLSTASQIKDTESWVNEWTKAGQRLKLRPRRLSKRIIWSAPAKPIYGPLATTRPVYFLLVLRISVWPKTGAGAHPVFQKAAASSTHNYPN